MDLAPLLRAHAYLRVERPPDLWHVTGDDEVIIRMLGEMIAAALVRGTDLGDVVLRANNVTVTDSAGAVLEGDYVAIGIHGIGDWSPEVSWVPDAFDASVLVSDHLTAAVRAAGVRWGYTRALADEGSVTVLLPRAPS